MTDLETRLEQALKADDPPPRDAMFRIETLLHRERAALRRGLLAAGAMALAFAAVAAVALRVFDEAIGPGVEWLVPVVAGGMLLAILAAWRLDMLPALRSAVDPWRRVALSILRRMPSLHSWH